MKTRIKVTIGDNTYEVESGIDNSLSTIITIIESIVKQDLLIIDKKQSK